jgi:hypothetical protein
MSTRRKVKSVKPIENYEVEIVFDNNDIKIFDVKPYLDKGIFTELKNKDYFRKVKVLFDSIAWPHGQDFDPDHLYIEGYNMSLHRTD